MKTIKLSSLLLVASLLFTFSCKKYEEGPGFSLISKKKRIMNNWTIEKTVIGGVEYQFSAQEQADFKLTIAKDGTYCQDNGNGCMDGTWEFTNNNEKLKFNPSDGSPAQEVIIIKLKNKEWGYKLDNGDKTYFIEK